MRDTSTSLPQFESYFSAGQSTSDASAALHQDAYKQSVGRIETIDGKKPDGTDATTGGTGFFVSKDGLLATDYHVIKDARNNQITVRTADGVNHSARIVGVDTGNDLALLQVQPANKNETFIPVDLATSSEDIRPNDQMMMRGHPKRAEQSIVANGSENAFVPLNNYNLKGGLLPGEIADRPMILTNMVDAKVQSGDSGSPLIRKSDGKVVGIVDFSTDKGEAISTPVEALHNLIAETQQYLNRNMVSQQYRIQDMSGRSPSTYTDLTRSFWRELLPAQRSTEVYFSPYSTIGGTTAPQSTISTFANIRTLPIR